MDGKHRMPASESVLTLIIDEFEVRVTVRQAIVQEGKLRYVALQNIFSVQIEPPAQFDPTSIV